MLCFCFRVIIYVGAFMLCYVELSNLCRKAGVGLFKSCYKIVNGLKAQGCIKFNL